MKAQLGKLAVLVLCAGLLPGVARPAIEYTVWTGKPHDAMDGPPPTTYVFDAAWRLISKSPDAAVLARHSPARIRLRSEPGRWSYSLDDTFRRSECEAGPFRWIISPSGSFVACVDRYYPETTLHVWRTRDRHSVATVKLVDGYVEGRNQVAFVDDHRVLFTVLDNTCRQSGTTGMRSISEVSIGRQEPPRFVQRCAAEVIAGTRHVAYLRRDRSGSAAYSIDGGQWVSGTMLAFDANDNPITEDSPPIRDFLAHHPNLAIWLVTVGLAPTHRK